MYRGNYRMLYLFIADEDDDDDDGQVKYVGGVVNL